MATCKKKRGVLCRKRASSFVVPGVRMMCKKKRRSAARRFSVLDLLIWASIGD